jgi:hypothetical protein
MMDNGSKKSMEPVIGLRLARTESVPLQSFQPEDSCEMISTLQRQDVAYTCQDYLHLSKGKHLDDENDDCDHDVIDESCRERMIEWCYRLCDCNVFPCDREMVGIAASYLDRFMVTKQNQCSRSTFRLAAVTSFYLATKILSCMQMGIDCLVDLGRGSFDCNDILQMELQLLDKLEWRMHPPTVQSYIRQFWTLISKQIFDCCHMESTYYRAMFFAELSVYEYDFVTKDRFTIALACMLNALETQEYNSRLADDAAIEMESIQEFVKLCTSVDQQVIDQMQAQLWFLYSCSAQTSEETEIKPMLYLKKHSCKTRCNEATLTSRHSPVSVQHVDA